MKKMTAIAVFLFVLSSCTLLETPEPYSGVYDKYAFMIGYDPLSKRAQVIVPVEPSVYDPSLPTRYMTMYGDLSFDELVEDFVYNKNVERVDTLRVVLEDMGSVIGWDDANGDGQNY